MWSAWGDNKNNQLRWNQNNWGGGERRGGRKDATINGGGRNSCSTFLGEIRRLASFFEERLQLGDAHLRKMFYGMLLLLLLLLLIFSVACFWRHRSGEGLFACCHIEEAIVEAAATARVPAPAMSLPADNRHAYLMTSRCASAPFSKTNAGHGCSTAEQKAQRSHAGIQEQERIY
jgi:hypothetical protein